MPLDATVGGTTANSYVTLDEAVAYMETNLYAASWLDLDSDVQEQTLMMATRQLDTLCFLGQKATAAQALKWPRTGLVSDGYPVPSDVIPMAIKIATCEQARVVAGRDTTAQSDAEVQGLEKIKAGSVELVFKEGGSSSGKSVPPTVSNGIPLAWQCPTAETLAALDAANKRKAQFAVI